MPCIHNNTLVFGTPDLPPLVALPELGAPYPHTAPFHFIDEYEARVARYTRQQTLHALVDGMVGLSKKLTDLDTGQPRATRPSFPIAGLPASIRPN